MKSTTPVYRLEMRASGGTYTPQAWRRSYGRPTDANLAAWVGWFEQSTRTGGPNDRLGPVTVWSARVVRQATDETVAQYTQRSPFVAIGSVLVAV